MATQNRFVTDCGAKSGANFERSKAPHFVFIAISDISLIAITEIRDNL